MVEAVLAFEAYAVPAIDITAFDVVGRRGAVAVRIREGVRATGAQVVVALQTKLIVGAPGGAAGYQNGANRDYLCPRGSLHYKLPGFQKREI